MRSLCCTSLQAAPGLAVKAPSRRPSSAAAHAPAVHPCRVDINRIAARRSRHVACAASAAAASAEEAIPEPEDARGAIALGLKVYEAGEYEQALDLFLKAFELPGSGVKRFRDKPKLLSGPEKMAIYYNIACCHSRLGNDKDGLVAVAGCLEAGYTDFKQLRTDPDLEDLRKEEKFEGLLGRFEKRGGGFFSGLAGN